MSEETWVFVLENGEILAAHRVDLSDAELEDLTRKFFLQLTTYGEENFIVTAKKLYDLLFAPIASELGETEHLVVVPDRFLRTIPFSVLHDREGFLVERFALTTGLNHLVSDREFRLRDGAFLGVPKHTTLPSLTQVEYEAEFSQLPVRYTNDVTLNQLRHEIDRSPSVLHLATHGQFHGSPIRSRLHFTDGQINALELVGLLHGSQINLLVLAACQTASGDEQASLGFHALALRANVDRVLGSLWAYRELEGSAIMRIFYQSLQSGYSPEIAMQKAQRAAIERKLHPIGWANLNIYRR